MIEEGALRVDQTQSVNQAEKKNDDSQGLSNSIVFTGRH